MARDNLPSDVKPLLEARCLNCHTEGNIGGIDLSDISTVQEWGPVIAHVTENRSMPRGQA